MFDILCTNEFTKIIAKGNLTCSDYVDDLIPEIERLANKGKFKILAILMDMEGIELESILDDLKTYVKNRNNFDKVAIVTHSKWVDVSMGLFRHIMTGQFKTFSNENEAEEWLTE